MGISYNFKKLIPKVISTCNISDAMDRKGSLGAFKILNGPQTAVHGRAVTCQTRAGDWWAVVKAIDTIKEGDILVASVTGGSDKAVMGELLAHSAKIRGASAIVIDGYVRDVPELKELGIPIYARDYVSNAGNPEAHGKIDVKIMINGTVVMPGDIIVCDGSGVVCVPLKKFDEVIEKAKGVVKKEDGIRKRILKGDLLGDILGF